MLHLCRPSPTTSQFDRADGSKENTTRARKLQQTVTKYDEQLHYTNMQYAQLVEKYDAMVASIPVVEDAGSQTQSSAINPAEIEIQTDKSFLHTKHQRSQSPVRKRRSRRRFSQRQQIEIDYIPGREKTRPKSGSKKQAEQFEEGEVTILQVDDELPQEAETGIAAEAQAEAGAEGNGSKEEDYQPNNSVDTGTITSATEYSFVSDNDTIGDDDDNENSFDDDDDEFSSLESGGHRRRSSHHNHRRSHRHRHKHRHSTPKSSRPTVFFDDDTAYKPVDLNPFSNPQAWGYFVERFRNEKSKILV